MKGRILQVLTAYRNRLREKTLLGYRDELVHLAMTANLDGVGAMEKLISGLKGHRLNESITTYRLYCRVHKLPETTAADVTGL